MGAHMMKFDTSIDGISDAQQASGIVSGTRVATTIGWRPVEDVVPGARVLTLDNGLQKVQRVEIGRPWRGSEGCARSLWPLSVPANVLGNQAGMRLVADQTIMLGSDDQNEPGDHIGGLMKAGALEGFQGIRREMPDRDMRVVSLYFDAEQIVFANIGALFLCPKDMTKRLKKTGGDEACPRHAAIGPRRGPDRDCHARRSRSHPERICLIA